MRKIVLAVLALGLVSSVFAQTDSTRRILRPKKEAPSNDHFFIQFGYTNWTGTPDSIKTTGFSRSLNFYVMLNFPFKTNPHWSVALGPGIGSDNMFFEKTNVRIAANTSTLQFNDVSDTVHFKRNKLVMAYLEAPVELRYRFNPNDDRRSVKLALGAKVGTLLNAHTKQVELQNSGNQTLNDYTTKESSKKFFSKQRLSVMGRVGYGPFSIYAQYSITPVFREGLGPQVRPFSVGLNIAGL